MVSLNRVAQRAGVIALVMLVAAGCGRREAPRAAGGSSDDGVITIPAGHLRPAAPVEGVRAYLGIPYGLPPVGTRRWTEAEPLPPSNREIGASKYGLTCRQRHDPNEPASDTPQGEDCLSLNVWRRASAAPGRPVMVWIHGGANVSGGTADPFYDGHNFVRDNDVVLVSINYRLGPFGFLDLSAEGDSIRFARSRNLGLLDQLAALRWVRQHIAAFGGDSANVTVFGESAGGSAIMRLMAMPMAQGLFDKAIIESGGPANIPMRGVEPSSGVAAGKTLTRQLMAATNVRDVAGLQSLTPDSILAAAERVSAARGDALGVSTWGARADDVVLPTDILRRIRSGSARGVKVLIGTNEDEMLYFRLYDPHFEQSLMAEYHAKAAAMGRSFATVRAIADRYTAGSTDPMRYVDFAGELWIRQPSILVAEAQASFADTYMYLWTWDSRIPGMGACHAIELPFVFGHLSGTAAESLTGPNPPASLSRRVQAAWTAFAASGSPDAPGETPWPRYTDATRATLLLDDGPWRVLNDPRREARLLLRQMYDVR
jgi:para-nitrobenzyl esterase